jgi:hypothetical protein
LSSGKYAPSLPERRAIRGNNTRKESKLGEKIFKKGRGKILER